MFRNKDSGLFDVVAIVLVILGMAILGVEEYFYSGASLYLLTIPPAVCVILAAIVFSLGLTR